MKLIVNISALALLLGSTSAFSTPSRTPTFTRNIAVNGLLGDDSSLEASLERAVEYKAGTASGDLAKRFGHLAGREIRTVGEAFSEFTDLLGHPINALYKNMMTDIVGSTHLTVVDARFNRDPVWSLGIITALELLLKNYPEKDISSDIISALFKCMEMDEAEVRAEAKIVTEWAAGKTKEDISAALRGEGDGPIDAIGKSAKDDKFWMYSRYFGVGLVKATIQRPGLVAAFKAAHQSVPVLKCESPYTAELESGFAKLISEADQAAIDSEKAIAELQEKLATLGAASDWENMTLDAEIAANPNIKREIAQDIENHKWFTV